MLTVMAGLIQKTALTTTKLNGRTAMATDLVTILEVLIQILVQVKQEILPKVEYLDVLTLMVMDGLTVPMLSQPMTLNILTKMETDMVTT